MAKGGRVACVVGAAGGIGSAVCRQLVQGGWKNVIGMDLRGADIDIDVTDETSVNAAFATARQISGRLDLLVVASGILDKIKTPALTRERWDRVLAVNLSGAFMCCKASLDWIVDGGRIVLVGSLAGRTGGVLTGTAYAVSKGGVESLTKSLANELAPRGITVNCVAPGGIDTRMFAENTPEARAGMISATPLKRAGRAEEVAGLVDYLASDVAGFVTGQTIGINGGLRMD